MPKNKKNSRKNIVILIIILSLFLVNIVSACITTDWQFTLNIGNINVNIDKLEEICRQETCIINEDFITIKSHYDERVAVIISKTPSILGFKGITIRLPYNLNGEGMPVVSEIDPETYDWKESVKRDLKFLKEVGVLMIEDSEIEKISNLATNGKNIQYCIYEWRLLNPSCMCDKIGEICAKCFGAPAIATSLPQKLLTIETPVDNVEEGTPTYYYSRLCLNNLKYLDRNQILIICKLLFMKTRQLKNGLPDYSGKAGLTDYIY